MNSPFIYPGGKRRVAREVLCRFGHLATYIEPFAGSLSVLLSVDKIAPREIVNDIDLLLVNFWRALKMDYAGVLRYADYPMSELDVKLRSKWLDKQVVTTREQLETNPDFYDEKAAGWWCWRQNLQVTARRGMRTAHKQGLECVQDKKRYMAALASRLRSVAIQHRDWKKALTDKVIYYDTPTGILLDPPYGYSTGRAEGLYAKDDGKVAVAVRKWAIEHGNDSKLRIALCGWEGEHKMPKDWAVYHWKAPSSKGGAKEVIWFSPTCACFRTII